MAHYTNVILVAGDGDDAAFEQFLRTHLADCRFMSVRSKPDGQRPVGGAGFWNGSAALASLRKIHLDEFAAELRALPWPADFRWVQVFMLPEPGMHSGPYEVANIFPGPSEVPPNG